MEDEYMFGSEREREREREEKRRLIGLYYIFMIVMKKMQDNYSLEVLFIYPSSWHY